MALSKVITLTVTGHTIKLSTPIKIFQNDQIYLVFRINEYGISVKGGNSEQKKIMPINPLQATLYIETPLGVDSIESASIEDNTVIFHLENKYTQYIGVSKMQIKLTDKDCCQITLPHFEFEVRENIYANTSNINFYYPYYFGIVEENQVITSDLFANFTKKIEAKGTKTNSYTTNNQCMLIAYPKSYGALRKILDQNSFDVTNTFIRSEINVIGLDKTSQIYYVYVNNASAVADFKITFQY